MTGRVPPSGGLADHRPRNRVEVLRDLWPEMHAEIAEILLAWHALHACSLAEWSATYARFGRVVDDAVPTIAALFDRETDAGRPEEADE